MQRLDRMLGLQRVKADFSKMLLQLKTLKAAQERRSSSQDDPEKLSRELLQQLGHFCFIGNPGTGKTTVAKMMGRLYKKMGLLSKGHVHEVDRTDLVGEYIGQTAPKMKDAIEMARGGVLFIDEAYALSRSAEDHKDFGREAVEILVKELSNGPGDIAIIVAGYP